MEQPSTPNPPNNPLEPAGSARVLSSVRVIGPGLARRISSLTLDGLSNPGGLRRRQTPIRCKLNTSRIRRRPMRYRKQATLALGTLIVLIVVACPGRPVITWQQDALQNYVAALLLPQIL